MEFWQITDTGKIEPVYTEIYKYLADKGYRLKKVLDNLEVFKIERPFVSAAFTSDMCLEIKNFFDTEYKKIVSGETGVRKKKVYSYKPADIFEAIKQHGYKKIFNELNFTDLPQEEVDTIKDTRDAAFYCFKNGVVQVTKNGPKLIPYEELKCFVDKETVIQHDIEIMNPFENTEAKTAIAPKGACFVDFLTNLCLQRVKRKEKDDILQPGQLVDQGYIVEINGQKFSYLLQLIGFLLHGYRQRGLTGKWVLFLDDEGGGSGKGLLFEAMNQLVPVCEISAIKPETAYPTEGKAPRNLNRFTRIKLYNDMHPTFDIKQLRNEVTDRQSYEYKFKDKVIMELNEGWKVAGTSNFIPYGSDDAELRRVRLFDIYRFFNKKREVAEHYNHAFFSEDWKKEDWIYFFNVMFYAVQEFFTNGYDLKYNDTALQMRKLEKYGIEFREWIKQYLPEPGHHTHFKTSELWEEFQKSSAWKRGDNSTRFGRNLTSYLTDAGYRFEKNPNRTEILIIANRKEE